MSLPWYMNPELVNKYRAKAKIKRKAAKKARQRNRR